MASSRNGTVYIGVTSDLVRRVYEHKSGVVEGFTKKYNVHQLVYYEAFEHIADAIQREKRLKKYYRSEKLALIESVNAEWRDLYEEIC